MLQPQLTASSTEENRPLSLHGKSEIGIVCPSSGGYPQRTEELDVADSRVLVFSVERSMTKLNLSTRTELLKEQGH